MEAGNRMRAIVMDRAGGPDVLVLGEIERPVAGPGQLLIDVAYAAVNPADWKAREGWLSRYYDYRFPMVLGFDVAGSVVATGQGVTGFAIGDRVVATSNFGMGERGAYADFVVVESARTVRLPDTVSLRDAAAMPTAGMTAWQAVFEEGGTTAASHVLVNGGAGGTGGFAVQFAHMAGAKVAATCSAANLDYVRSLGADLAIDYRAGSVWETVASWAPGGVDLIVDTVGQGTLPDSVEMVRAGGIVASIGTLVPDEPMPDPARAQARNVRLATVVSSFPAQERQLPLMVDALAQGRIRAPALEIMPLAEVARAHRRVADGHVRGKILLAVSGGL